ncbi:AEC family transporter [Rhodobacteraceae bacterium NNCM2]|nr:AEC family transporter [Coraliihabitans acroporae]
MSAVIALLLIVLPVFIVVAAGYVMVRKNWFPEPGIDPLIKFATGFAVPVLLFRAMYGLDIGSSLMWEHQASFYIAATTCFVIGIILARVVWKRAPGEAVAVGFCALFSNSVLFGLPIMERAYGRMDELYALVTFHMPFCYFVGILAMEFSRRDGVGVHIAVRNAFAQMFRNALTIGLGLGLLANVVGVSIPAPISAAIDMIARAALPVALFAVGGVLTRYSLKTDFSEALMVSILSVIVHPLIAWFLTFHVFGLSAPFVQAAVVMAAMPTGLNGYIFAATYHRAEKTAASAVLIATALSILTIPVWLAVLGGAALG